MKHLFALSSVTALVGIVLGSASTTGCGSSDSDPDPVQDAGTDVRPRKDARVEDEDSGSDRCYSDDPVDLSEIPYKPPRILHGSCDPDVFDKIKEIFEEAGGDSVSYKDLEDGLVEKASQQCADCVFGPDGDEWAPVVVDGNNVVALNLGGCVQIKSESEQCGEAVHKWFMCIEIACASCRTSDQEYRTCRDAVQESDACKDATIAAVEACGNDINDYLSDCDARKYNIGTIGGAIDEMCVGPQDPGTDE
jgi:hypothetical protein